MVMMSGIFAAFAALRNQLKGSTCPTSGGRSWRLPCPASLGGVTNTAPDLPTALALSWPGHYARKPWLIGARLILFQLLSMGVQWSRLWSCKACILVRQREAKRTATAEMPSQGQGEPSSGQAAAAVVQPQACPAFQQLVQHLSQDRSASQALTRATQSQSQGQPSQHSNPLSQVGQSPFRLRSEKAWYVEQVATLSSQLHDLGVFGKQAAEDSEKALLEARGAARHLAVGLSELAGMLSRAGVAPSAPTSDAERTNMLKRVHTAVQRLQTREQEGAEAKATLGDVLAAFRASGFSHLSTAAGAEDLMVKIQEMAVQRYIGIINAAGPVAWTFSLYVEQPTRKVY